MSYQPATIAKSFSCHAFNEDKGLVALSPNNEDVIIYNTNGSPETMKSWTTQGKPLTEHGGAVSAIDWHPETNLIVTSGHDRNAYVWKLDGDEWKPTLVILRINRAATSVRWCPNGNKFAVTSGAKCVPICHFEEANDWWISKMIKKHKSTVLCISWSPNNKFVVTGSTDFKCRIFSAYIEGVDEESNDGYSWGKANDFGQVLAEFDQAKAWVNGVSWSPCGGQVVFTGHGSSSHFVTLDTDNAKNSDVQGVYSKFLPNLACEFMSSEYVVMCGFDMNPQAYEKVDGEWRFTKKLDEETGEVAKKQQSDTSAARNKFKNLSKHGQGKSSGSDVKTFHKNIILGIKKHSDSCFSTCGADGRILIWNL